MENQNLEQTAEKPQVNEPVSSTIDLNDLQNVLKVFDVCSARGAFKANEMEQIGVLYNKILKFLNTISANALNASVNNTNSNNQG